MPRASSVNGRAAARGWVWRLSMLWVVLGAGGAGYAFISTTVGCTTNQCTNDEFLFVLWNGEPGLIAAVGNLAGWRRRNWLRTAAWAGAWVAGIALMALLAVVAGIGSESPSLGWGALELPIFAAWLALGVKMTQILGRASPRRLSNKVSPLSRRLPLPRPRSARALRPARRARPR